MWSSDPPAHKAFISFLYESLSILEKKIKSYWEEEVDAELTDDYWERALKRVDSSSSCAPLALIQLKLSHTIHESKSRRAEIYPGSDPSCDRCSPSPADVSHMFWSWSALHNYGSLVFRSLWDVFMLVIEPAPQTAIFGAHNHLLSVLNPKQRDVVAFTTLLARRRIQSAWKSPSSPSHCGCFKDIMSYLTWEQMKPALISSSFWPVAFVWPYLNIWNMEKCVNVGYCFCS